MKRLLTFLILACLCIVCQAKDAIPAAPNPPRLVNDYAGVFSAEQKASMEKRLVDFNDSTSNVVCVVIVDDLGDYTAAEFAFELGNRWGVQDKKNNNGLVILIKTRNETAGDVFIATGYAFESVLPDAYVKSITSDIMVPQLKEGRYYEAVSAALDQILPIISGEISAPRSRANDHEPEDILPLVTSIFFIAIFFGILGGISYSRTQRRNALITKAVKEHRYEGEDKEALFIQVKKLGMHRSQFETKLKDEILKQLIAPALEDKIVTSEERRYIFQQAAAMGFSHTSVEKKLQQMIDEEATKIIDEELELHNGHIDEKQLAQKLLVLGVSALVLSKLFRQRKTAYHTRHGSNSNLGGGFGRGFGSGGGGSFGGGFGGFGSAGGFGGGGAGSKF